MKRIFSGILVLIVATSLSSAKLNKGFTLHNEISRIVNGETAEDGQFPYQVRLILYTTTNCTLTNYICGGSIIAKNWVMTAGHCTIAPSGGNIKILGWTIEAGEIFVDQPRQRRIVLVADAYPHPNFNTTTLENDIGLLRTALPFDFSTPFVQPIHLVPANVDKSSYVGKLVTVSGFGFLTFEGPLPTQLYYTNLTVIDFKQCDEMYTTSNIPSTSICAENDINNSSTCFFDSGGPLTLLKNGKLIQIGIVSFGGSTCNDLPNGFTDVTQFIPWIHKMIYGVQD